MSKGPFVSVLCDLEFGNETEAQGQGASAEAPGELRMLKTSSKSTFAPQGQRRAGQEGLMAFSSGLPTGGKQLFLGDIASPTLERPGHPGRENRDLGEGPVLRLSWSMWGWGGAQGPPAGRGEEPRALPPHSALSMASAFGCPPPNPPRDSWPMLPGPATTGCMQVSSN